VNSAVESAATDTARAFIAMFNAQDHHGLAGTLNYPHIRLANERFVTVTDAEAFARRSAANEPNLTDEGWHHTVLHAIEVIHSSPTKVHMSLTIHRCHEDGTVYNTFDTLWIATCDNGHWGIQFRSSYLR
jgi:hypothetical protein